MYLHLASANKIFVGWTLLINDYMILYLRAKVFSWSVPSGTVISQYISLGQQVSIRLMVSSIWAQLKQLQRQSQLRDSNAKIYKTHDLSRITWVR